MILKTGDSLSWTTALAPESLTILHRGGEFSTSAAVILLSLGKDFFARVVFFFFPVLALADVAAAPDLSFV